MGLGGLGAVGAWCAEGRPAKEEPAFISSLVGHMASTTKEEKKRQLEGRSAESRDPSFIPSLIGHMVTAAIKPQQQSSDPAFITSLIGHMVQRKEPKENNSAESQVHLTTKFDPF